MVQTLYYFDDRFGEGITILKRRQARTLEIYFPTFSILSLKIPPKLIENVRTHAHNPHRTRGLKLK